MRKNDDFEKFINSKHDKGPKMKESRFMLTVNSQQVIRSKDDQFIKRFRYVVQIFLENITRFVDTHEGFPMDDERTCRIEAVRIETGPNNQKLHFHANIEFTHYSRIRLNLHKIREYFKVNLTGVKCHVYLKVIPSSYLSSRESVNMYILKHDGEDDDLFGFDIDEINDKISF